MAYRLFVAFLLAFTIERFISEASTEEVHLITWDRFWLNNNTNPNLNNLTLEVQLGDKVRFLCRVDPDSEEPEDQYENVVFLTEESYLNDCSVGTTEEDDDPLLKCVGNGVRHDLLITDGPELSERQSFKAGESYYFTSFSDGSLNGAQDDVRGGGACTFTPPLRLTISVSATVSSFSSTTTVAQPTQTSSSSTVDKITPTSVKVATSTSEAAKPTVVTGPPPTLPKADALSGARLSSSLHPVLLLLLFITCILLL